MAGLVASPAARPETTQATPPEPASIEAALEHGYLCGDITGIGVAMTRLHDALARDPQRPELIYLSGFAYYAAAQVQDRKKESKTMIAELERAVDVLATVQGEPWESEAMALQGAIDGQLIELKGGLSGMSLGPKSGQLTTEALKRLPNSPRVRLFRAEIVEHTPKMFGGDPVAAAKLYQEAVDLFAAGEKGSGPRWGRVEALNWLGLACKANGDTSGARTAWEQALTLEPEDRRVKFALRPSLRQKTTP